MKKLISIALLTLTFAFPALSQEATPESSPAPVVVEVPVETPASPISFSELLNIVLIAMLGVQTLMIHKSIPASFWEKAIPALRSITDRTLSPLDDAAVDILETGVKVLSPAPESTTTTTTTTITAPVEAVG